MGEAYEEILSSLVTTLNGTRISFMEAPVLLKNPHRLGPIPTGRQVRRGKGGWTFVRLGSANFSLRFLAVNFNKSDSGGGSL